MSRWRFWDKPNAEETTGTPAGTEPPERSTALPHGTVVIRDAERRRLYRLLQRKANIEYDIAAAHSAFLPENRWTERIEQLSDAILQAEQDIAAAEPEPSTAPPVELPATPVEIIEVSTREPVSVRLSIGANQILYREEVDWAERGHQLALPQLTRAEGDVDPLLPDLPPEIERDKLVEHLRHGMSIIANEALERAIDKEPLPTFTLADLVRPCRRCGGWLDPKGRCPSCAQLEWQLRGIREDRDRLIKERNDVREDLARIKDRLPVFNRQLIDVEADIQKLRDKVVEPA
jgi:hypothetical protein